MQRIQDNIVVLIFFCLFRNKPSAIVMQYIKICIIAVIRKIKQI